MMMTTWFCWLVWYSFVGYYCLLCFPAYGANTLCEKEVLSKKEEGRLLEKVQLSLRDCGVGVGGTLWHSNIGEIFLGWRQKTEHHVV